MSESQKKINVVTKQIEDCQEQLRQIYTILSIGEEYILPFVSLSKQFRHEYVGLFSTSGELLYELFQVCDDICTKLLTQHGMMCSPGKVLEYKLLPSGDFIMMKSMPISSDFYYAIPESVSSPFLKITFFDSSGRLFCIELASTLC